MSSRDQNEHPLRFAVTASTVSGLLVVLVTAITGRVVRSDMFTRAALPWVLAAITWVAVASGSLILVRRKLLRRRSRQVFLMIPAFSQKHWVAELIREIHDNLERRGYDLVLKIPDRDYSGTSQIRVLEDIVRHKSRYAGGLIVANEIEQTRESLVKFCASASIPVIFVDVEPFKNAEEYPPRTAFVGYDAGKIGGLAADWLIGYLRRLHVRRPRVLVITGDAHRERQYEFCRSLRAEMHDVQIIEDSADFDRLRAREVARKQLRRLSGAGQQLHAIFCTNDEMALGAVDALIFADTATAGATVVIGVDGTPQARALIDAGPSPLRATVVQDAAKMAEITAELLEKMIRNDKIPTRTSLTGDVLARE
jgi:ribose transport system substrate-binding protein